MQRPQRSGYPNQRIPYAKRCSLHKISDGNAIWTAGVPHLWRQASLSRAVCELANSSTPRTLRVSGLSASGDDGQAAAAGAFALIQSANAAGASGRLRW